MSSVAENITLVGAVAGPFLTATGVVIGSWVGRRQGLKTADAAVEQASAEARRAVTADWESYTGMLMKRLETVESRAGTAEKRLDSAETRAVIAEERATRWESLYRIAVMHMREIIKWANDSRAGSMPEAPAELQDAL
jgi:hypothetical protein